MIKSAFQSMRDDFQRSLFYWFTFVLTTTFMNVFFQIACSPMIGMTFIHSQNGLVSYLSIFVIGVCLFSVFFANDFYTKKKAKDLAVRLVCGATYFQLTTYLLSQTMILFIIAIPFAVLLSFMILWLLSINIIIPFTQEGINVTVIMLLFEIFWCTILNLGYAYRSSIVVLIQGDRVQKNINMNFPFHLNVQMKRGIGIVLFILPVIFMYIYGDEPSSFLVFSIIGMIGLHQCFHKVCIPDMDHCIQKTIHQSHQLVYLGFLRRDLVFMGNHIIFLIVSAILLIGLYVMGLTNPMHQILVYVSFVATNCLLSLTILFRFSSEMIERQKLFLTLKRIGYEDHDLQKIIQKEMIILYMFILCLGLFYIVNILMSLYIHNAISLSVIFSLLVGLCIPLILCGLLNYAEYKKQLYQIQ